MAQKLTLEQYRIAIGQSITGLAQAVEKMSGLVITNDLICEAEKYLAPDKEHERIPMARPKAEAIAKYLSVEMDRPISVSDIGIKAI